jgi:hypothetical protein
MVGAMAQMMPNGQELLRALPDPFQSSGKLARVTCQLLVRAACHALPRRQ